MFSEPKASLLAETEDMLPDKVEAAYRRGDLFEKRRQLMDAWARHCSASTLGQVLQIDRTLASNSKANN